MRLLGIGAALEIVGLILAAVSVIAFGRITMLVFFTLGIPAVLADMGCYLIAVLRVLVKKGAL